MNITSKDLENLPPITVTICQAEDFFTIKISDCGGGMDQERCEVLHVPVQLSFNLHFDTICVNGKLCPIGLAGCGLPMARLYARYFQGEIKMSSYEGYGTDVYIYLSAVPHVAMESLPVYKRETRSALEWDQREKDWSSWSAPA